MTEDASREPPEPVEIELEALPEEVVDPNQGYQPAYYPGITQRGDYGLPVPDRDGHLCPHCDYDVRGLAGRICPECGHRFTIIEAQRRARSKSPERQRDFRAIAWERWAFWGVVALVTLAFFAPFIVDRSFPTRNGIFIQIILLVPFPAIGVLYSYCVMRSMKEGMLVAAIMYLAFSFVMVIV